MSNPHSRSEQDCMKMCLKNGVPHNGTLVWGTPMYRCGAHRFYVAECIVIMLQGVSEAGDFFLFWGDSQYLLERHAYGKVESEISVKVRVSDRVVLSSRIGRIDGFHAGIEADDEEICVHAETYSIADGNLFEECVEMEFSAGLVFVFAYGPNVSSIDKGCAAEFPE